MSRYSFLHFAICDYLFALCLYKIASTIFEFLVNKRKNSLKKIVYFYIFGKSRTRNIKTSNAMKLCVTKESLLSLFWRTACSTLAGDGQSCVCNERTLRTPHHCEVSGRQLSKTLMRQEKITNKQKIHLLLVGEKICFPT